MKKEIIEIKHGSENMCDLLNQEQAELKKAMIEKMAHTLYCKQDKFDLSNPFEVAKAVVEAGYRKIPEGAVVLTKEDQNKTLEANEYRLNQLRIQIVAKENDIGKLESKIDDLKTELKQARKETAREILDKVDYKSNGQTKQITDLLRRKYGVEVEE